MQNKLTSMVTFVLEQAKSPIHRIDVAFNCIKYAKFLSQPLTLGMFVPCDENNVPLDDCHEPDKEDYWDRENDVYNGELYKHNRTRFINFKKAKERVLFEGFKLLSDYNGMYRLRNEQNIDITFDSYGCYAESFDSIPGKRINAIEEITYLNLTLTAAAIKSIYGS